MVRLNVGLSRPTLHQAKATKGPNQFSFGRGPNLAHQLSLPRQPNLHPSLSKVLPRPDPGWAPSRPQPGRPCTQASRTRPSAGPARPAAPPPNSPLPAPFGQQAEPTPSPPGLPRAGPLLRLQAFTRPGLHSLGPKQRVPDPRLGLPRAELAARQAKAAGSLGRAASSGWAGLLPPTNSPPDGPLLSRSWVGSLAFDRYRGSIGPSMLLL